MSRATSDQPTVTLLGAQYGIDARTRAGAESVVNFAGGAFGVSASNVVIDGFTVQGQTLPNSSPGFGYGIYMVPGTTGTQVRNDIVQNNYAGIAVSNTGGTQVKIQYSLFQNNTGGGIATDIYADQFTAGVGGLSNVLIDSNKFTNTSTVVASWALGISNTDPAPFTGLTFTGNEITNHGRGLYLYNTDNVIIANNTITGVTNYAIGLFDGDDNVSITNNRLQSGNRGVWLGADFGNQNTNVSINLNAIVASGSASIELDNGSYTGVLDASANYFGSSVPATVQATFANNDVDTTIDFTPLLNNDESVPNQSVVGFTPDLSSLTVHASGAQTGPTGRIQEGVNLATAGGTVNVLAGSYAGGVLVNKTLTVTGAGSPTVTAANLSGQIVGFQIGADNVVLQGFNITGNATGSEYGVLFADKLSGLPYTNGTVQNNQFSNLDYAIATADGGVPALNFTNAIIQNNVINVPATGGWGVYLQSGSGHVVYGNSISGGAGTAGILVQNANNVTIGGTGVGQGNTITGTVGAVYAIDTANLAVVGNSISGVGGISGAVRLEGGATGVTINQNSITGGSVPAVIIRQNFSLSPNSVTSLLNNFLTGNTIGIQVNSAGLTGNLDARFNNLSSNSSANVQNNSASFIDVSGSYLGSTVLATVLASIAGTGAANVDSTPFLNLATDTSAAPGFQGDFSSLTVHTLGAQTGPTGRIQEGVNLVSVAGTVNILAGSYTDTVNTGPKIFTLVTNGASAAGIVNVAGSVTLGSGTTFQVDILSDGGGGQPVAGTHYDQWNVTTAFSAGSAILDLVSAVAPPINLTKLFTIVGGAGAKNPAFRNTNLATINAPADFFMQDGDTWYLNYNNAGNIVLQGAFNNPPVPVNPTFTTLEDGLAFNILLDGTDVETPTNMLVFTVTSLPEAGTLYYAGLPVLPGQTFTGAPANRTLVYVPGGNPQVYPSVTPYADSFSFKVTDTGGVNNLNPLSTAGTVGITVNPSMRTDGLAPALATDPLVNNSANNVLYITGTLGNDTISVTLSAGNYVIARTGFPNVLIPVGNIAQIRIFARGGVDYVNISTLTNPLLSVLVVAGDGNDTVYGSAVADIVYGGAGADNLSGNAGADFLSAGLGDDTVYGGAGNDIITGGAGTDFLYGEADDDTFLAKNTEAVSDRINGGANTFAGFDTLLNSSPAPLVLNSFAAGSLLERINGNGQPIVGTAGVDNLDFSTVAFLNVPYVDGLDGNDTITGTAGADVIYGGNGSDLLNGGPGADLLFGYGFGDAGGDAAGNDTLRGGDGADTLHGGLGVDSLFGDAGNDSLNGDAGNDYLNGGADNDSLFGGAGSDTLYGGDGNDLLNGGPGGESDWYYGEAGDDTIQLQGSALLTRINGGVNSGVGDKIELLSDVIFSAFNAGNLIEGVITNGFTIVGTAANDTLDFSSFTSVTTNGVTPGILRVNGLGGADTITGTKLPTRTVGAADYFVFDPATVTSGTETSITNFAQGYSKIDVSTYGPLTLAPVAPAFPGVPLAGTIYRIQSGLDTVLLLNGKRIRIKNFTATSLLTSDFVGSVS